MPWLQPNNYTESLYLFPACVLHYNGGENEAHSPSFLLSAGITTAKCSGEKTGWTLYEFEERKEGKGEGTIFKLGRRKNSF